MHITLMPYVPNYGSVWGIKHAVKRDRQLDNAKVRGKVAACLGEFTNKILADLFGKARHLALGEGTEVLHTMYLTQKFFHRESSFLISCFLLCVLV
jgi:hypothetical protein